MKLKKLAITLERLETFESPSVSLEQYATPSDTASRLLFHAMMHGDITDCRVCDLGCGSGVLACGAALLDAEEVFGVDIDPEAIRIADKNAVSLGLDITWIQGDIREVRLPECDTVIMNPPFGAQKGQEHADRPFIDAALRCAPVVYGIFNSGSRSFVESYIKGRAVVDEAVACGFVMKRTFAHHTHDRKEIPVEVLRLERK